MAEFWVIGPIAWDRVLRIPRMPPSGGFVQATEISERPGGAGANVAIALASTGAAVHMVGYVGDDEKATRMRAVLGQARVDADYVHPRHGHTSEVDILVEPSGERTMIGIWPDLLHTIPVPVARVRSGDMAYFAAWHQEFSLAMQQLTDRGAVVATVPPPRLVPGLPATYLIGSQDQYGDQDPRSALSGRTATPLAVIVTRGADGVIVHDRDSSAAYPAQQADVVDTTGAGDAFTAGFLHRILSGDPLSRAVAAGIIWAAATVQEPASIPPPWPRVASRVLALRPDQRYPC
jgi:sugar/nucleoside kinase (ribokinase family)